MVSVTRNGVIIAYITINIYVSIFLKVTHFFYKSKYASGQVEKNQVDLAKLVANPAPHA